MSSFHLSLTAFALACVVTLGACPDPSVDALPYACESSSECGAGFECAPSGRCVKIGADVEPTTTTTTTTDTSVVEDVDASCTFGTVRCSVGGGRERCDQSGAWEATDPCPATAPTCIDGLCGCTPTTRRCSNAQPELCNEAGAWVPDGEACAGVCIDGACASCTPDTVRCAPDVINVPENCGDDGEWKAGPPCTYVCIDGACSGSCVPGDASCDGLDILTCDDFGVPQFGETCEDNCSLGVCTGPCEPDTTQCRGVDILQVCVEGTFVDDSTCPNVCRDGGCTGDCKPGAAKCEAGIPSTCNHDGQWVAGSECQYACVGEGCGGVCEPGDRRCTGNVFEGCNDLGAWDALLTCEAGCTETGCADCVPVAQDELCEGKCGTFENNCRVPVDCGSDCPGPGETCGGADVPNVCGCISETIGQTCAGKCGVVLSNCGQAVDCTADNGGVQCLTPSLCGVGNVPTNTCCAPAPVSETCAGRCGIITDNCAQTVNCGDDCAATPGYTCGGSSPNLCGCEAGAKRCSGRTPQACQNGQWVDGTTCEFVCAQGECGGGCNPGDFDCNGNIPRACDGNGQWVEGSSCGASNQTCSGGSCVGECILGQHRCSGQTAQTCDGNGQWSINNDCTSSTCVGGSCVGVCAPGDVRCKPGGSAVLQSCDGSGQYSVESACSYYCNADAAPDRCDGNCVNGGPPRCGDSGVQVCVNNFLTTVANCPEGCNNGMCCQPSASLCTGDPGAACNTTLTKDCGVPVACDGSCDPGYSCGASQAGVCGCRTGEHRCNGDTVQVCNGTSWIDESVCSNGNTCIGQLAACGQCTPFTARCNGNTAEVCGTNGFWPTSGLSTGGSQTNCSSNSQTCMDGQCQGVCAPGQIGCVSFYQYSDCIDGQFIGATTACPDGLYCQDTNPDFCGCSEGEFRCNGEGDVEYCSGATWQLWEDCGGIRTCCWGCFTCLSDLQCSSGQFCLR